MSYIFLQEQGEESSVESFSDIPASVLSRLNLTPAKSCSPASVTESFRASQSGMTSELLTGDLGAESWTPSAVDSPAKTSQVLATEKDSRENAAVYGVKCGGWFAKYDPASCSWKTPQCSLFEDLELSWLNWPRWGIQRLGECFPLPMLAHDTSVKDSGSWPTPTKSDSRNWESSFVSLRNPKLSGRKPSEIHPLLHEILMGWPIGWTDLLPLATDKFRLWLRSHGESCAMNPMTPA